MQKCLQKKNKTPAVAKLFLASLAVFAVMTTLLLGASDTRETTPFGAKHGKYLDISDKVKTPLDTKSTPVSAPVETKMNNLNNENSKSASVAQAFSAHEETEAVSDRKVFPETIGVYFHETGETVQMKLEEYVVGVVLSEMPSSFSPQALMAQAVAVRSFTCHKTKNGGPSSHEDAAVCTDYRHCQSYISPDEYEKKGDYAKDALAKIRQAVEATRGICVFYDAQPIMAVYHASSGTGTKNSEAVWGGHVPYLVSVPAPEDKSVCSKAYEFGYAELEKKLSDENGSVSCFSQGKRSVSCDVDSNGLVTAMHFSGRIFDRDELCARLGLRSEEFSAVLSDEGITFTAYGYGHRVGMSQYGADALAKKGYGFMDILKYYYTGVSFAYVY